MASTVCAFSADHQYRFQRQQWLRVDGVAHSREQLQQLAASAAMANPAQVPAAVANPAPVQPQADPGLAQQTDPVTRLRAMILSALTGRAIDLHDTVPASVEPGAVSAEPSMASAPSAQDGAVADALTGRRLALFTREQEQSQVSLSVSVSLDGQEISGGFCLNLSRREEWQQSVDLDGVRTFLDPLVLNFGEPLALSSVRTDFDLNADGHDDAIARFASDSYALVRDLNGNGRIDDGTEVIGALSGDGFAELRALDDDGNGLITAQDAVWQSLRLWRPGDPDVGVVLAARQVQALGLQTVASPFSLTAGSGALLGQIRSTGYFVAGNTIRSAQQVDLAV